MAPSIADLLATGEPLALPGVYDALWRRARRATPASARSSSPATRSPRRGSREPDFGLLTQTEVLDAARRVSRRSTSRSSSTPTPATATPSTSSARCASSCRPGAAGCFLEDQVWPKRCGHMEGKQVVPLEEYLEKLARGARGARRRGFHVTARTDARAPLGLDEAIRRARAFAEAGADAVFVEAPRTARRDGARPRRAAARRPAGRQHGRGREDAAPHRRRVRARRASASSCCPIAGLLAATHALARLYAALARDGSSRDSRATACSTSTP